MTEISPPRAMIYLRPQLFDSGSSPVGLTEIPKGFADTVIPAEPSQSKKIPEGAILVPRMTRAPQHTQPAQTGQPGSEAGSASDICQSDCSIY
jgi:hypothetical protein